MEKEEIDYNVSAASKDFLGSLGLIPNNFEYRWWPVYKLPWSS